MATLKSIVCALTLSSIIGLFYLSYFNKQNILDPTALESNIQPTDNNEIISFRTAITTTESSTRTSVPNFGSSTPESFSKNNRFHYAKRRKIFLMETSGNPKINARQACAVESAARQNPNMDVILYFISQSLNISDSHITALTEIENIRFRYINLKAFFMNTPLENWYNADKWKKSPYKISHMSDALRFLTLWKFGGIYLDLDVVVIKSLEDLKNCAGKESGLNVAAGVMAFDKQHPFLNKCLDDFAVNYRGSAWGYNGPELVTRVMKNVCGGIKNIKEISREKCKGVTALPVNAFYSVPWPKWKQFFDIENAEKIIASWRQSYLIHVWNKHSVKTPIVIGSGQPYELAAKKYCPMVYATNKKNGSF